MIEPRRWERPSFFATLVRDPANWKAALACLAGIAFAAYVTKLPEPAPQQETTSAAAPAETAEASAPVMQPAESADLASSTASACAERSWPYVDQSCDESASASDGRRQVRVISTDKTAPATISSKPATVAAAPRQEEPPQTPQPVANAPAKTETVPSANAEMFGSGGPAAIAALRVPPSAGQTPEQPATNNTENQSAAAPSAGEPQPQTKATQRAANEKKRTRTAERPRPTREAVRMDGDQGLEPGAVVEERIYQYSDGRTVTVRRVYRNGGSGELSARDDRSVTRRVPLISAEPVLATEPDSDRTFSRIY